MKTFKTLLLAGAGLLLAGAANAQVGAPTIAPVGPTSLASQASRAANNINPTANSGRTQGVYYETSVVQQLGSSQYASVIQAGGSTSNPLTADIQQEASASNSDAYQEQTANPSGFGAGDHAYIYQGGGLRDIASQRQQGNNNDAAIRQTSGDDNRGFQHQMGDRNYAQLDQSGGLNFANQVQNGLDNQSKVRQENSRNWSTTNQQGNSNTALVHQY